MEPTKTNGYHPNYKRETDHPRVEQIMDELDGSDLGVNHGQPDHNRIVYVREYAAQILCALIMRRASSDPEYLVPLAVRTAGKLYDHLQRSAGDS